MFNAAAIRRTGCALLRNPRTPTIPSRTITFSTRPQPLPRTSNIHAYPHAARQIPQAQLIQTRFLTYFQRTKLGLRQAKKGIWRKHPITLPFAIVALIGSSLFLAYVVYIEVTFNAPQYHNYPQPVAKPLREAVYYTDVSLEPRRALEAYKEALKVAIEMGMHPYSDEVLGIKIQVATMLEKAGLIQPAVELFEKIKTETLAWVEISRNAVAEKEKEDEKRTKDPAAASTVQKSEADSEEALKAAEELKKQMDFERLQQSKAVKKAVGMCLKLGELYASDHIQEPKKAEAAIEASVEIALKELAWRESHNLPVGAVQGNTADVKDKDVWLNMTEIAIALASLGSNYLDTDKPDLAMPLFMRALHILRADEGPNPTCMQTMLLARVSVAMAAASLDPFGKMDKAVPAQLVNAANQWALKALQVGSKVPESEKSEVCGEGCLLAAYTLGDLAQRKGDLKEAEKWYRDAIARVETAGSQFAEMRVELEKSLNKVISGA